MERDPRTCAGCQEVHNPRMVQPLPGRERRFFLGSAGGLGSPGGPPCLAEEDLHHALHVNRLQAGDILWGLDGAGSATRMRVVRVHRKAVELEELGETIRSPRPGAAGAELAWVEMGVALPKPAKLEPMVDRLTQLGIARLQPLICERTPSHGRVWAPSKQAKLERTVREAMKQSGRLWPMDIEAPVDLATWCSQGGTSTRWLLDSAEAPTLVSCLQGANPGHPIQLGVGPEGGWTPEERLLGQRAHLRGHVLRTETAAELAGGLALQVLRTLA